MESLQTPKNTEIPIKKGRGQYERKARGSYKDITDKKISVKHFLNKTLRPDDSGEYPIYVRVSVKSQTTQIPCEIISYKFKLDAELDNPEVKEYFENDIKIIEWIIIKLKPFERDNFLIKEFTEIYKILNSPVSNIVEKFLFKEISESENAKHLTPKGIPLTIKNKRAIDIMPYTVYSKNDRGEFIGMGKVEEFVSDIWGLNAYEDLFYIRNRVKKFNYTLEDFILKINPLNKKEIDHKMRLVEFLSGEYQERLIHEFGSTIMQPIFDDIYKLFKRNMQQFEFLFNE
jgi:hypothetical protein